MSCMVCGGERRAAIRFGEFAYCRCIGGGLMSMEPRPSVREIEQH